VEETVHPPQHINGKRGAPSHYGLLLIIGKMASLPFLEPRADIVGVTHGRLDAERRAGKRGAQFGKLILTVVFERMPANRRSGDDQNGFRGVVFWSQSDPQETCGKW
jgi:hypothetical protein